MIKLALALLSAAALLTPALQIGDPRPYKLTAANELELPKDYQSWPFVGSAMIPDEKNNDRAIFPGIHLVYIDPDAYRHRQEKGTYPDGAIVVMEVRHAGFGESESGFGYFTDGGMDLLVQIKDRRTFPGSGWAYFAFLDKDLKSGKKQTAADSGVCQSCHQAGAEDDELFTQYYPALKKPD